MIIDDKQNQLILGSLLGDAGINKDKRYEGYEFAERHSLSQIEYLKWKNEHLNFNFSIYEKKNVCAIRKNNKIFKEYRELFYPKGTKIVTKEVLNKLNPLGLAIWHMDDGNYSYKTDVIRLYTQAFKLEGNRIIKEWFKKRLNIDTKIKRIYRKDRRKEYFYTELNHHNAKKFIDVIKNNVIQPMEYKIGLDDKRRKDAKAKLKEYSKKWWAKNEDKRIAYYQKWKRLNYQSSKK